MTCWIRVKASLYLLTSNRKRRRRLLKEQRLNVRTRMQTLSHAMLMGLSAVNLRTLADVSRGTVCELGDCQGNEYWLGFVTVELWEASVGLIREVSRSGKRPDDRFSYPSELLCINLRLSHDSAFLTSGWYIRTWSLRWGLPHNLIQGFSIPFTCTFVCFSRHFRGLFWSVLLNVVHWKLHHDFMWI